MQNRKPKPGHVWICAACGRISRRKRFDMGDMSCVLYAVEVTEAEAERLLQEARDRSDAERR